MADKKKSAVEASAPPASAPEVKPATKSLKVGKLRAKNKSRLPRRQKKAQKKAAARL
jgi:hypothetical protein